MRPQDPASADFSMRPPAASHMTITYSTTTPPTQRHTHICNTHAGQRVVENPAMPGPLGGRSLAGPAARTACASRVPPLSSAPVSSLTNASPCGALSAVAGSRLCRLMAKKAGDDPDPKVGLGSANHRIGFLADHVMQTDTEHLGSAG